MVRYKLRQAIRQLANNEPLARPTLNGDGLCASYTQDTVLNIPPSGGDDVKLRRAIGEAVANIVIQSDRVPASQRREAIRRTILEQLGPAHPTIRLDGASANRRNESMEAV